LIRREFIGDEEGDSSSGHGAGAGDEAHEGQGDGILSHIGDSRLRSGSVARHFVRNGLFAEHLQNDKNNDRSPETASEKKVNERITCCGKEWLEY